MDSKKAQGISLNFIVIAIIAALVLVIIIAFTVGGLGTSLSKIFEAGESSEDSDVDFAKASCEKLCLDAMQVDKPAEWASETYCEKTFVIDGKQVNCWQEPIGEDCSVTDQDVYGELWECDQTMCDAEEGGCANLACSDDTDKGYSECIEAGLLWEQ